MIGHFGDYFSKTILTNSKSWNWIYIEIKGI